MNTMAITRVPVPDVWERRYLFSPGVPEPAPSSGPPAVLADLPPFVAYLDSLGWPDIRRLPGADIRHRTFMVAVVLPLGAAIPGL